MPIPYEIADINILEFGNVTHKILSFTLETMTPLMLRKTQNWLTHLIISIHLITFL